MICFLKKRVFVLVLPAFIQGCAAAAVADMAVGTTAFVTKTAVKGTVGAGKLVYRGGKAVAGGLSSGSNNDIPYEGGPQGYNLPSCLNDNGSYSDAFLDQDGTYYCPG